MRRIALLAAIGLVCVPAARAATTPTLPVYDSRGRIIQTPFAPPAPKHLSEKRAEAIFLAYPKVRDWLTRYPVKGRTVTADYSKQYSNWTVKVWWGKAGEIAMGRIDDSTGYVTEAWTGPQVAWSMARGGAGAFGGKKINSPAIWLGFCAFFLLGLVDWRRPVSLRTLDLLGMLSFSVSLWYFNHGNIFASAPLAFGSLAYLLVRGIWIGVTGRAPRGSARWPAWVLLAATVFALGFRIGLNTRTSNVIDVGYSGVIGAERIVHGQAPYDHMPVEDDLKPCGPKNEDGEIRDRIQTNGRCESANDRGDTYGPVAYEAYIPEYLVFGWSGKWDSLPASHATAIVFDILCLIGLGLVGFRFGGPLLGASLAFAWATYPFTQYVSNSNTNDSLLPAFLIWGFWLLTRPAARGVFVALAGWTKFAALIVAPMWATYRATRRELSAYLVGFAVATLAAFSILLLEPNLLHAIRVFWDRTVAWQFSRDSPFSIWDWKQYYAKGIPSFKIEQRVFQGLLLAGALVLAVWPRRKTPLQLAAFTGVLLVGFEAALTHWFYLYIPWFFPFVAFASLAAAPRPAPVVETARDERPAELVQPV
jgi:hypothetical protein